MLDFMGELHRTLGWRCLMLDVGGSMAVQTVAPLGRRASRMAWTFGVPADAPDPGATLGPADYSRLVCGEVFAYCRKHRLDVPELVMEPGRALSADAQSLISTVLETRRDTPLDYAVTDVGTAVAPSACSEYHQMGLASSAGSHEPAQERVYRVVGPICHLGDVAAPAWQFPVLSRGDRLVMMDTGAYFISDASSFSFPSRASWLCLEMAGWSVCGGVKHLWIWSTETLCLKTTCPRGCPQGHKAHEAGSRGSNRVWISRVSP